MSTNKIIIQSNNKLLKSIPNPIIGSVQIVESYTNANQVMNEKIMDIYKDIARIKASVGKSSSSETFSLKEIKGFAKNLNINFPRTANKESIINLIIEEYEKYVTTLPTEDVSSRKIGGASGYVSYS